jgi:hypothetical protein
MVRKRRVPLAALRTRVPQGRSAEHRPRAPRGGQPPLRAAAVLTMGGWGAGRGRRDTATLSDALRAPQPGECPGPGAARTVGEAPARDGLAFRGLRALILARTRRAPPPSPVGFHDSAAVPAGTGARARPPRTWPAWARKSRPGRGWGAGFTAQVQGAGAGRRGAVAPTPATVAERQGLDPRPRWLPAGMGGGERGASAEAKAYEPGSRGGAVLPGLRNDLRQRASPFQFACRPARQRREARLALLPCAFGLLRPPPRASAALPVHWLGCLLASSLYTQ